MPTLPDTAALAPYLAASTYLDHDHPAVAAKAAALAPADASDEAAARAAFVFVRDAIRHSVDFRQNPVTRRASEVLAHGTGYCYAKAHLLAALLRARGVPAGLCYQRLVLDPDRFPGRYCLHGLVAVHLRAHGWHRIDPRGNKPGVDARFTPPVERLAFAVSAPGEADLSGVFADPLPVVLAALHRHDTWDALLADLPDLDPNAVPEA
ncbi:MAG: transglutaminase-like enzyme, predicted cysteine protease [Solidesulfovibrio magneticus str. Maddingley MBC34]|uniref:Transglutaminase-like enzyme, predicted cysteine protease n=1 Tax=Solidesulfovibrio magneticus str. Maddingley MBC34 TaxID=1206767 RepID=K6GQY5_9BACT|nr:MAG: transglutaminase-like enzyme, predicted cysteine protease [Solidesulfovibrio magneticus str. Maddingley MBC34]